MNSYHARRTCIFFASLLALSACGTGEDGDDLEGRFAFSAGASRSEQNRTVSNVTSAFDSLTHHGEWLGFRRNSQTPVTVGPTSGTNSDHHFQGIARSPQIGRAPVLYLTHSGDPEANLSYHRSEGRLLVVRMASRNQLGERFRSNRLLKNEETQDTKPPVNDQVIDVFNFDHGDVDYKHPGGIQMVGDVLAVPLEQRNRDDLPFGKIVFFGCADPEKPELMSYQLLPRQVEEPPLPHDLGHDVGVVGITKLPDGDFFLAATWGDSKKVKFYRSNFSSFFDDAGNEMPGFAFEYHSSIDIDRLTELEAQGYWRFGKTSPQTLNFINQGDKIYLIGSSNSSSLGAAWMDTHSIPAT